MSDAGAPHPAARCEADRLAQPGTAPARTLPPLALYAHFPWCVRKCPYCDFNSHALKQPIDEARYVTALLQDLQVQAESADGRPIESIFFGGGTPSLFSPDALQRLLAGIRACLRIADDAEVTLEANPGTVERGRFRDYRGAGITRVSLGAQSFSAEALKALGRIHGPEDTVRAVEELHVAGLGNFNLDLMYGLPGQDLEGGIRDLERAIALAPAHLSHYQLTLEPGTPFAAAPPALPDEDLLATLFSECAMRLAAAGFARYEVSAYAQPGRRCRHNLNYWRFGDYLGVGAGAHGKITARDGTIVRSTRWRDPRRYVAGVGSAPEMRTLRQAELPFEFMLNALRLTDGFELELYAARTGEAPAALLPVLRKLEARGLVELAPEASWVRPTVRGMDFVNTMLLEFLPEGAGIRRPA